jgi:hypothetical protein
LVIAIMKSLGKWHYVDSNDRIKAQFTYNFWPGQEESSGTGGLTNPDQDY